MTLKPFCLAIGGECFDFIRPVQPMAQAHPPGIAQPEERRAVGVLKISPVGRDSNRAVLVERVLAGVGFDSHFARDAVQTRVLSLSEHSLRNRWIADVGRRVADLPLIAARPKRRHAKLVAVRGR